MQKLQDFFNFETKHLLNKNGGNFRNTKIIILQQKNNNSDSLYFLVIDNKIICCTYSRYKEIYINDFYYLTEYKKQILEFTKFFKNTLKPQKYLNENVFEMKTDFIKVMETNNGVTFEVARWYNYNLATCEETQKLFKSFNGYTETKKQDKNGLYIFTRSAYGFANHLYFYVDAIGGLLC